MMLIPSSLSVNDDHQNLLLLASFFPEDFSIDWIQTLSGIKATQIIKAFKRFVQDGILMEQDIGVFYFLDAEKKQQLQGSIPTNLHQDLRPQIAEMLLKDISGDEGLLRAADQLLHIQNDFKGCEILCTAGDQYRRNGQSGKALSCYDKAIQGLKLLNSLDADKLFIQAVIGYSKDHRAIDHITRVNSLLQEALERAERLNNPLQQAIVLMHLASNNYIIQNAEIARAYFSRGYSLAKGIDDPNVERSLITGMIIGHAYSGRFKSAVKIFESFEPFFLKNNPLHKLSLRVAILVGLSYACIGQISQGLGLLDGIRLHSLKIKDYDTATTAAVDIGLVLMLTQKIDEAIDMILDTLADNKGRNQYAHFFGLYYLAYCFYLKGQVVKSRRFLIRALKISKEKHYDINMLPYFIEICLAMELGHYPSVSGISPKEEIKNSLNSENIVVKALALRSMPMIDKQNLTPDNRLRLLTQSLNLMEESGYTIEIAKTNLEIGRHFLQLGDSKQAKDYVTNAKEILYPFGQELITDDLVHLVDDVQNIDNLLTEIVKLGQELINQRDTREVVQHIFSSINRITGAERGAIFLATDSPDQLPVKLWAAKNLTANDLIQPEFSESMDIICKTMVAEQPDFQKTSMQSTKDAQAKNDGSFKSRICIPLSLRGNTIGVLYHDNRFFESTFKEEDSKVLLFFASLAAIVLDDVQAYEKINILNQRLHDEHQYLKEQQLESFHPEDFVAASPAIKHVLSMVRQVADTKTTVLILGETGVGKEMVARAIQQNSSRSDRPYIRVNCSALAENLIPSELFGHERGAFTNAIERRIGRFELADGGTLFLDEIGELPNDVQIRLLRVLQTGEFERIGGRNTLRSDFRLLVATNKNLEEEVAAGRFRADLYYRLNVFPIMIPPLRVRKEDVTALANFFLHLYSRKLRKSFKGIPKKEMEKLLAYNWPGNVRELENIIERGVILSTGDLFQTPQLTANSAGVSVISPSTIKEMERELIIETLKKTNWKISGPRGAAELLDINYSTLYSKMKKLGITKSKRSSAGRNIQ